jgi:transposase InsO family protein
VVHAHESGPLAVEMMKEIFGVHGVPQVVHADRGTSMTSKTVAALLSDLEVTRSHSRPKVSNDNPYSDYPGLVIMPSMNLREHVCAGQGTAAA